MTNASTLQAFSSGYECLTRPLIGRYRLQKDLVLRLIEQAAEFASNHHPGRFADGLLENPLLDIGSNLERYISWKEIPPLERKYTKTGAKGMRRIVHVASSLVEIGGHTRTIQNWMRHDPDSNHSVFLIRQGSSPLPGRLEGDVFERHGQLVNLPPNLPNTTRAIALRRFVQVNADLIVLHHSGHDVVPTLAFACEDLPPVTILNHADHLFWLGSSIADTVINQRDEGMKLSEARRFTRSNTVLPIPLSTRKLAAREEARSRLGIPAQQQMLLSVGRGIKYKPTQHHDFLKTMRKILNCLPSCHLHVVGLSNSDVTFFPDYREHDRIHLHGPVVDPSDYQSAADLYVESFPFGSSTAMLEAARAGLPVVWPFNPPFKLLVTNHGFETHLSHASDESEYIDQVCELVTNRQKREWLGNKLKNQIFEHHIGDGWRKRLSTVYDTVQHLSHSTSPLPKAKCLTSDEDEALAGWQAAHIGQELNLSKVSSDVRDYLIGFTYWARQEADYSGSVRILKSYLRARGYDKDILLCLMKLPAHWVWKRLLA